MNSIQRIVLVLCLCYIGLGAAKAQETDKLEFNHGLVGGLGVANFHSEKFSNSSVVLNRQLGWGLRFSHPNRRIGFMPQLLYVRKGGEGDYLIDGIYSGEARFRLHYVEVPLLVDVKLGKRVSLLAGVHASYLFDASFDFAGTFAVGYGSLAIDELERLDYGLIGGIAFNGRRKQIALKYTYGLNPIAKETNAILFLDGAQNNTITLSISRFFKR